MPSQQSGAPSIENNSIPVNTKILTEGFTAANFFRSFKTNRDSTCISLSSRLNARLKKRICLDCSIRDFLGILFKLLENIEIIKNREFNYEVQLKING